MSPRRAATCAHCSATLLKTRTPVLNHSSPGTGSVRQSTMFMRIEVGADEKREQRADDGEKHAQADLRRRQVDRVRAGKIADPAFLQPGLGRQPLLREPPSGDARYDQP